MSPHAIDMTTGAPAFIFNKQRGDPWHTLGEPIDGAFTAEEIVERVPSLGFFVDKRPLYATPATEGMPLIKVPNFVATVRTDTEAVLGVVGETYRVYQNNEAFVFLETLVAESGALFDTAGSLFGGKVVFAQMDLGDDKFWVKDDPSPWVRRLLGTWGHDGRHAYRILRVSKRVVCANTHAQAIAGAAAAFTIRHTSGMNVKVEEVARVLSLAQKHDEAFVTVLNDLTRQRLTWGEVVAFTEKLIPIPDDGEKHVRLENARELVTGLYKASPTLDGVPETAYRLFQATVEYADHFRTYSSNKGSREDARAVAILDGAASALKDRALALLAPAAAKK